MINSLPATWHRQIHHQDQNWIKSRQMIIFLTIDQLTSENPISLSINQSCMRWRLRQIQTEQLFSDVDPSKINFWILTAHGALYQFSKQTFFSVSFSSALIPNAKILTSISYSSAQVLRSQMRWSTTGWLGTTSRTGNWDWWSLLSFSLHNHKLYHRHLGQCCLVRTPAIVKGNNSLGMVWLTLVLELESSSMCCYLALVERLLTNE